MRAATIALLLVTFLLSATYCAADGKITLDAQSMPLKDVVAQLTQQSQATIVLDPKAEGSVTINLTDVDISQALDVVTKLNKLTWRKVSFALPEGDTAKLEQIKSAVLALASIPVTGMMVDDPATKQSAVVAKGLPSSPETSAVKLPEGYSWKTFYVVTPPIVPAPATTTAKVDLSADQNKLAQQLAAMTPEERKQYYTDEMMAQMTLAPEARQALIRDRMEAMHNMDPQIREQMHQDMRAAFGGQGWPGRGDRGTQSTNGGGTHRRHNDNSN
jgi:hypothetical protein